ncbi:hypothetical protein [Acinetobacter baumannii]|uniref:hypothetical protein n=1 Tax=Acinetobacter baumannii TaxID=470 RepID=UPI00215E9166|nr:hypothetical protein [Acinetobacter baumannii]
MGTKYDWSEIPPEVQFMATDFDGWAFGYKSEPERLATEFSGDLFLWSCSAPIQQYL